MNRIKQLRGLAMQAYAEKDNSILFSFVKKDAEKRKAEKRREKENRKRNRKK